MYTGKAAASFSKLLVVITRKEVRPVCSGSQGKIASIMHVFWNALFVSAASAAVTFTIPSKSGEGSHKYAPVDPAPVGIS